MMILLACYTLILISMMIVFALSKEDLKKPEMVWCVIVLFPIALFAGLYLADVLIFA